MKRFLLAFMLTIVMAGNFSYAQGIQFIKDKWSAILLKATEENKIIFVDAFATWCGPCKMMDRNVFSTRLAGDFFNEHFINVKIDMEADEGPALAHQFGITAYPTFLFINKSGEIVHRGLGYQEPDQLLSMARKALDEENNQLALKRRYQDGERDPEFLYKYALQLYDAQDVDYPLISEEYLKTQDDWSNKKNMELIYKTSDASGSTMLDYFLTNKTSFEKEFGERAINGKIQYFVQNEIYNAQQSDNQTQLKKLLEILHPGQSEEMLARINLSYLAQNEKYDEFAKAAIDFYKKYDAENWDELNEVAWLFHETIDNTTQLKFAVKLAKKSVKMDANYYNHDTLALLYEKLGKQKKAIKLGKKAIELAHQSGDDCSSTEIWLKEIQSGK